MTGQPFTLPASLGYLEFETWLHTLRSEADILVDARALTKVSPFAATLLYSKLVDLQKSGSAVRLICPSLSDAPLGVRHALWSSGVLKALESAGVAVDADSGSGPVDFLSFHLPEERAHDATVLWKQLKEQCARFLREHGPQQQAWPVIEQLFDVPLFELIENAKMHGDAKSVHYGVVTNRIGRALLHRRHKPDRRVEGPMADIYVGDLGPGIEGTLSQAPDGYQPPYTVDGLLDRTSATVLRACEFSVTRSPELRAERIGMLLADDRDFDASRIATGLFAVAGLVRNLRGQLVLRTPGAALEVDFTNPDSPGVARPLVTGKGARLGSLAGTHVLARVPLTLPILPPSRVSVSTSVDLPISVVDPFEDFAEDESPAIGLQRACQVVDSHLARQRPNRGMTLILPARVSMPTRAEFIFAAHLLAMPHNEQRVLWISQKPEHLSNSVDLPSSDLPGQGSLAGQLWANRFWRIGHNDRVVSQILDGPATANGMVRLAGDVRQRLLRHYTTAVARGLAGILKRPPLKETGSAYLFQRQYYTQEFYNVARFLADSHRRELVAEWVLASAENRFDALVVHTKPMRELAESIQQLQKRSGAPVSEVIFIEGQLSGADALRAILPHLGKAVLILSDIICTGRRIGSLISYLGSAQIVGLFAIVDARPEGNEEALLARSRKGHYPVPLKALLRSPVKVYKDDPPPNPRPGESYEIAFIDPNTLEPTVYSRRSSKVLTLDDIVEASERSNFVVDGHIDLEGQHFLLYVHLPRFLTEFSVGVTAWIREETRQWTLMSDEDRQNPVVIAFPAWLDLPQGATTIADALEDQQRQFILLPVSREELAAPPPIKDAQQGAVLPDSPWIIWLPAVSSGETWRGLLEFASRFRPMRILVLCMVSRLQAKRRDFLVGVSGYHHAAVRASVFAEIPVPSYNREELCPRCRLGLSIDELARRTRSMSSAALVHALASQAETCEPLLAQTEGGYVDIGNASQSQRLQAMARLLYSAARQDTDARRTLDKWLGTIAHQDAFLEMLGSDLDDRQVAQPQFGQVLYNSESTITTRLIRLLNDPDMADDLTPQIIKASVLLAPEVLIDRADELFSRFGNSPKHSESLATALLFAGIRPEVLKEDVGRATALRDATYEALRRYVDGRADEFMGALQLVSTVWAALARSGDFSEAIRAIPREVEGGHPDRVWQEVRRLRKTWLEDISGWLRRLEEGPIWPLVRRHYPQAQHWLAEMVSCASALGHLHESTSRSPQIAAEHVDGLRDNSLALATALHSFYVNPLVADVLHVSQLMGRNGETLTVQVTKDFEAPLVFCHPSDLNRALAEIVDNWRKYATSSAVRLTVRLASSGREVVYALGDDIEGDVDFSSSGGMKLLHEFCIEYGGRHRYVRTGSIKWLEVVLPAVASPTVHEIIEAR